MIRVVDKNREAAHRLNRFAVIPAHERLGVHTSLSGKGVTIAFLDSGFYPHPDLCQPKTRIVAYKDVTGTTASLVEDMPPDEMAWHGTQTAVAAAGNGMLSDGTYRGLAHESNVVLVKAGHGGHVTEEHLLAGIEWVIRNRRRHGIRILSISLGGDHDLEESAINRAAERAVAAGVTVIAAAGNRGCSDRFQVIPPANAPSIITVGAFSDGNRLDGQTLSMYCSSFNAQDAAVQKPEIIAPGAYIAAPILPSTPLFRQAAALSTLDAAPDFRLPGLARDLWGEAGIGGSPGEDVGFIRRAVEERQRGEKLIATHYQYVEGTSFAAPIVASVVALMLECNPSLTPRDVKRLLTGTATPLPGVPHHRQGFGVLNASLVLLHAEARTDPRSLVPLGPPRVEGNRVFFSLDDRSALSVHVTGDFNSWETPGVLLASDDFGRWHGSVETDTATRLRYKFLIDGARWIADPLNARQEDDGYGGTNSIVCCRGTPKA